MNSGEDQPSPHSPHADEGPPARAERSSTAPDLARELTGDLPCISCGYNLRSISVLGVCPECGAPVRATILARVDPYAGVLQPISRPRTVALGLLLWAVAALCAVLSVWGLRLIDVYELLNQTTVNEGRIVLIGGVMVLLSGIGAAISLVRPHPGISLRHMLRALLAVFAYIPLFLVYWQVHAIYDPARLPPFIDSVAADPARSFLRLAGGLLMLLIVIGLRPNLRLLISRSLLLRMGRVERQTMLGLAAAIGLTLLGDLLHIVSVGFGPALASAAFLSGLVFIAVGTMLFTLGLIGILVDCLRIIRVVLAPPISYAQVLGPSTVADRRSPSEGR